MKKLLFALSHSLLLSAFVAGVPHPAVVQPALAQSTPQEDQLRSSVQSQPQNLEARLKLAEYLLKQLRQDWSTRDPQATGPQQIQQNEAFQRRATELIYLYQSIIDLNPQHAGARVDMAEVHFSFQGQYDKTEALLQEALQVDPQSVKANIAWAEYLFFFRGKRDQALDILKQQLKQQAQNPELSITLADLTTGSSQESADFLTARQWLTDALQAHPGHRNLRYMLASTWARQAQLANNPDSAAQLQTSLDLFTQLLQEEYELSLSIEAANLARSMGRLAQARNLISEALKQDPGHPLLVQTQGDLWLQQGAQDLDRGRFSAELEAAESHYLQTLNGGRFQDLTIAQRVQLYFNLGLLSRVRAKQGHPEDHLMKSVAYFKQAQELFDRINMINAPLQTEMAQSLTQLGALKAKQNVNAAASLYREACQLKDESACDWLKQKQLPL